MTTELIYPKADLYILGSGIRSFIQLTLETQHILRQCNELFYFHDLPSFEKYVKTIHPRPVNLLKRFYIEGQERLDIYKTCADFIVKEAAEKSNVVFITHGHPLVGSTLAQIIIEKSRKAKLKFVSLPAVCCLDSIGSDLGFDIAQNGTQVLEAGTMLLRKIVLNPNLDAIVLQIADSGSTLAHRTTSHKAIGLKDLKNHLLRYYPSNHMVKIVESSVEIGYDSVIREVELGRLDAIDFSLLYNQSLFIPAISSNNDQL